MSLHPFKYFSCSHCYLCFTRTLEEKPSPRSELTASRDSRVPWEGEVVGEPVGALRVLSPHRTLPALTASLSSPALSDPWPTATGGAPWPDTDGVGFLVFPLDPAGLGETPGINQAQHMWMAAEPTDPFRSGLRGWIRPRSIPLSCFWWAMRARLTHPLPGRISYA